MCDLTWQGTLRSSEMGSDEEFYGTASVERFDVVERHVHEPVARQRNADEAALLVFNEVDRRLQTASTDISTDKPQITSSNNPLETPWPVHGQG